MDLEALLLQAGSYIYTQPVHNHFMRTVIGNHLLTRSIQGAARYSILHDCMCLVPQPSTLSSSSINLGIEYQQPS
ncbi:unnamed protein product [Calypogeia fissa]